MKPAALCFASDAPFSQNILNCVIGWVLKRNRFLCSANDLAHGYTSAFIDEMPVTIMKSFAFF